MITKKNLQIITEKANLLYGKRKSNVLINELNDLIAKYKKKHTDNLEEEVFLNEEDIVLITYGDSIQSSKIKPLKSLMNFINKFLYGTFNIIHILPFYPYSSDDGFSVVDYKKVNPSLGTWKDIESIQKKYKLMIDFVANHISSQSSMFQEYLNGNKEYDNYFIGFDKVPKSSSVTRAREHSLFSLYSKEGKDIFLWTTFSRDQIDLNYANEKVLLKMIVGLF